MGLSIIKFVSFVSKSALLAFLLLWCGESFLQEMSMMTEFWAVRLTVAQEVEGKSWER